MTFSRDKFKKSVSHWAQQQNRRTLQITDRLETRAAEKLAADRKRYRNSGEPKRYLREHPEATVWDQQDHEALALQVAWWNAGAHQYPKALVKAMRELMLNQHREEAPGRTFERPVPVDAGAPPQSPDLKALALLSMPAKVEDGNDAA
jgi:hypothetical protein